jgi:hypothetical protein
MSSEKEAEQERGWKQRLKISGIGNSQEQFDKDGS